MAEFLNDDAWMSDGRRGKVTESRRNRERIGKRGEGGRERTGRMNGECQRGSFTAIVIAVLSPWIPGVICGDEFRKPMKLELMASRCRLFKHAGEYIKLYIARVCTSLYLAGWVRGGDLF